MILLPMLRPQEAISYQALNRFFYEAAISRVLTRFNVEPIVYNYIDVTEENGALWIVHNSYRSQDIRVPWTQPESRLHALPPVFRAALDGYL